MRNRYLSSFGITATVYAVLIVVLFYMMNSDDCEANSEVQTPKVVRISLLNLEKETPPKKPTPQKPTVEKKVQVKKKVVQKVEKAKQQVKVKTTPVEVEKVMPEIVKEVEVVEESEKEIEEKLAQESHQKALFAEQELQERQKSFFLNLRERINKNKSYPNSARRRAIQGNVEVCFCVLESGRVKDIELVSGRSIFKKSAFEAIQRSFPIDVDKTLFSFPKEFKITISYILK